MATAGYSEEHEIIITDRFNDLLSSCSKIVKKEEDWELIRKAFFLAKEAHKGVLRRSGEPYILHPLAVAKIVVEEIGLGVKSVAAALLHDVVEDTAYTVEEIDTIFGEKIAYMVDGLTKMAGVVNTDTSKQAAYFRKVLLTLSDDVRVILIKIADRLHNMRTMASMPRDKQVKISSETLYLFAPLAYRLGLYAIKTELEDLSLRYRYPEQYFEIVRKLDETEPDRNEFINRFIAPIRQRLTESGIDFTIAGRVKSIFSIWSKMQRKGISFEDVYDLFAIRIVFKPTELIPEKSQCWHIYSLITDIYAPKPDRIRDWVNFPKANGYEALHATVMGPDGIWAEVQIRSERMEEIAERGFAAHWKYKEGGGSEDEGELEKWLKTIKEILDDPQPDAIDFLDTIKLNLFASEIFVFTPKGELKTMPQNSTALDFAFSLHTDIGSHCIGAKVNHKLVPLSHKLQSGDQVEILTSKSQRVQPQWEVFATTARARAKIAAILRKERKINQKEGEELLNEFLKKEEIRPDNVIIAKLSKLHNMKNEEELFIAIGNKSIILGDADKNELKEKQSSNWKKYLTFSFGGGNKEKQPEEKEVQEKEAINPKQILKLTEEALQKQYIIAECCHPIPGDDVLGYIDENDRVIIHKRQCPVAAKLKSSYGNRIIATVWDTHKVLSFLVYIYIKGIDSMGLLNEITQVISRQLNVNIRKLDIETNDGIFEGKVQLYVHDVDDVKAICDNLRKIQNIKSVTRVEN